MHAENAIVFESGSGRLAVKAGVEQMVAEGKDDSDDERSGHQTRRRPVELCHLHEQPSVGRDRSLVDENKSVETVAFTRR